LGNLAHRCSFPLRERIVIESVPLVLLARKPFMADGAIFGVGEGKAGGTKKDLPIGGHLIHLIAIS